MSVDNVQDATGVDDWYDQNILTKKSTRSADRG